MINKLILRKPLESDLNQFLVWENSLKNIHYTDRPVFYTVNQLHKFLNSDQDLLLHNQLRLVIQYGDLAVGCIDLYDFDIVNSRAGVGIFLDAKFRSQGLGAKSLALLKKISSEQYIINGLYADIISSNISSIKIFEKNGFIKTGTKKSWFRVEDSFEDVIFFQCLLANN